ncbi:MAG: TetR/AcrR family transcriptional regulator [Solirubrobacterales bacterium]
MRDQRRRIHTGVAKAIAGQGYERATVERIIKPAGVSRRTFYEIFPGKDDAFLSVHEETLAELTVRVAAAARATRPWARQVGAAIATALEMAATRPEHALLLVEEPPTGGPRAAYMHDQLVARFAPGLRLGRRYAPGPLPATLEQALLSGLVGVVVARLRAGRAKELAPLATPLAEFVLTPYVGAAEARAGASDI